MSVPKPSTRPGKNLVLPHIPSKTFIFYEVDDLLFDAVLHLLALALLDQAFEANVRTVQDFYRIRVPPPRHSLEFRWRKSVNDIPIFRQAVPTSDGTVRTSDTEALRYHTYLYYLQRLGLVTGFMQILNPYCIRRGSGEGVEGERHLALRLRRLTRLATATQAQLQQVMCHINAATYQAYINQRVQCDTVGAFLGRPSNKALLKAAGHMSRHADPRAPTNASAIELEKIKTHPTLVNLIRLRDALSHEIRRESGTIKAAEEGGSRLYEMYRTVENKVRSTRSYLRKLAKVTTRGEFFDTIHTIEINAQLKDESHAFLDLKPEAWQPQQTYGLEERRLLAELICADSAKLDDEMRLKHRLYTTNAMVSLGSKKESRPPKVIDAIIKDNYPKTCGKDQCFICFWDETAPQSKRLYKFFSAYRARDHLVSQHLKNLGQRAVQCPEPKCRDKKAIFWDANSFQNHLTRVHKYDIFYRYKGSVSS